jgi:hypothetical protein
MKVSMVLSALVASGVLGAPLAQAKPASALVLVSPAALPALARQGGESMFLRKTVDGRVWLYIERDGGKLARLDVTCPAHIRGERLLSLGAPEPSDVLSTPANAADVVQLGVSDVRARITNDETGTTFVLTDRGLYLERSPSAEMVKRFRDQAYAN